MPKELNLAVPTIHMNGSPKDRLVEDLCEAYTKLGDAYEALKQTAPHGRDFYPQGHVALQTATAQHLSRLQRVDDIRAELTWLAEAIQKLGRS